MTGMLVVYAASYLLFDSNVLNGKAIDTTNLPCSLLMIRALIIH